MNPAPTPFQKPLVLIFSLGHTKTWNLSEGKYAHLMVNLIRRADLKIATNFHDAVNLLGRQRPRAILVTDPGILAPENERVVDALVAFARTGGRVVLGSQFNTHVLPAAVTRFFRDKWNLPWESGNATVPQRKFELNQTVRGLPTLRLPPFHTGSPTVALSKVGRDAALYLRAPPNEPYPPNEPQNVLQHTPNPTVETPLAFTEVGSG